MSDNLKPLRSGYAPKPTDLPGLRRGYQVKLAYYYLSGLLFLLISLGLYLVYDLKGSVSLFAGLTFDSTIVSWYVAGVAAVFVFLRLRSSFCVVCNKFRWPTRLDLDAYCDHCGAHLYKYDKFIQQKEERSKHDLTLTERFMEMVARGDTDAVRMLLYKGAHVNSQDRFGNTALMNAAMRGNREMVDLLLQYRADPKLTNNFGLNALMIAVDKRHHRLVEALLAHGMPVYALDKEGRSALDLAKANNDEEMIALLQKH